MSFDHDNSSNLVSFTPESSDVEFPPEGSKEAQLQHALKAYHLALTDYEERPSPEHQDPKPKKPKKPSIRSFAEQYGVNHITLSRRYKNKAKTSKISHIKQQRLTPAQEKALVKYVEQLESWSFPPCISHLRFTAQEIALRNGDTKPIGINWVSKFMKRHPELATRYQRPLEKDRANNATKEVIIYWFDLIQKTVEEHQIAEEDQYNMDERGSHIGKIGKDKVVCSFWNDQPRRHEATNTEWASVIECISMDGRILPPFFILKCADPPANCIPLLQKGSKISPSETGWTNNTLGYRWFEFFNNHTESIKKGKFRLLILMVMLLILPPERSNSASTVTLFWLVYLLTLLIFYNLLMYTSSGR